MKKNKKKKTKKLVVLTLLVLLTVSVLATGCSGKDTPADSPADKQSPSQAIVPDWLQQSLKGYFDGLMILDKDKITMVQVTMKENSEPQIAASYNIDDQKGIFVLYEKQDNAYKEVYSKKEPVYGIQVFGQKQQQVAFVSGSGGMGLQENYFHLLAATEGGYKEVWANIAKQNKLSGTFPYFKVIGAINLEPDNNILIYSKYKEVFNDSEKDVIIPDEVAESVEVFHFNQEKEVYEKAS